MNLLHNLVAILLLVGVLGAGLCVLHKLATAKCWQSMNRNVLLARYAERWLP